MTPKARPMNAEV